MAGRYQKIQALLPEIRKMMEGGMTQRKVEEALGLERETVGSCTIEARTEKTILFRAI